MTANIPDRHPFIVDLLKLLSSEEEQLAYEKNVPHVDITAELRCMWFDDLYCPQDAFFRSCFTAGELEALAQFHESYLAYRRSVPRWGFTTHPYEERTGSTA